MSGIPLHAGLKISGADEEGSFVVNISRFPPGASIILIISATSEDGAVATALPILFSVREALSESNASAPFPSIHVFDTVIM